MSYEFVAKNGLVSLGNAQISGSLKVTAGVTASLLGTSSWAVSASWAPGSGTSLSASYAYTASIAISSSYAGTATYALNSVSSSWASASISSSYSLRADNADASISSSWASASFTASYASTSSYLNEGANIYLSQSFITSVTNSVDPAYRAATLYWDDNAKTYAMYSDHPGVSLQIGQEQWVRVYADEYVPDGSPVYVHSSLNGLPCVRLALADGIFSSSLSDVIGVATENISSGSIGVVTSQGIIHDIDTSMFSVGDVLYLSHLNSGSLINYAPNIPYDTVTIGYVLVADAVNGKILVDNTNSGENDYPFIGVTRLPSISISGSNTLVVSTGSANLCTTADGFGHVRNYNLPSASFTVTSSLLDVQFLVVQYNNGIPVYNVVTDLASVDEIQTTPVASFTLGTGGQISYIDWDSSGVLLANKLNKRIIDLYGVQRASGLELSTSASHITISAGTAYLGIKKITLSTGSTANTNQFVLLSHSASAWSGSFLNGWVNNYYDNGTSLLPLGNNKYVVNYVYRGAGSLNRAQVILTTEYNQYADAVASTVPTPPAELMNTSVLVGRIITQQGNSTPLLVESAFTTILSVAGVTDHNQLLNLQGGISGEYYHLTFASYASASNGLARSASYADSASHALYSDLAFFSTSSSWSQDAMNATYADTASYFGSGSNGYVPYWISNSLSYQSSLYTDGTSLAIGTNDLVTYPRGALTINEGFNRHIVMTNPNVGGIPWSMASTDDMNLATGSRLVFNANNEQSNLSVLTLWSGSYGRNVGINNTSPKASLDISGSVSASGYYYSDTTKVSFVGTASSAVNAITAQGTDFANLAQDAVSASYAATASIAISASYANTASYAYTSSYTLTASHAITAATASTARTASYAIAVEYAPNASSSVSSSFASQSLSSSNATTASHALDAVSASYALTSSVAIYAGTAPYITGSNPTASYIAKFTSPTTIASSNIYESSGKISINTTSSLRRFTVSDTGVAAMILNQADAPLDYKNWHWDAESSTCYWGALNDAGTAGTNYFRIQRSGSVATQVDIMFGLVDAGSAMSIFSTASGVRTYTPKSTFDVAGNVSIGSYGGTTAAPSNGLIVSGKVGIGTSSVVNALDVNGNIFASTITASLLFGTASRAITSSFGITSSYTITSSYAITSSYTITSSYGITASYALNSARSGTSTSSSYSDTSNLALFAGKAPITASLTASEAIGSCSLVNVYYSGGVYYARLADYTAADKEATGYVTASYASGAVAIVYFNGVFDGFNGLSYGDVYLGAAGAITGSYPTSTGYYVQYVGKAVSSREVEFAPQPSVGLSSPSMATGVSYSSASYALTSSYALNSAGGIAFIRVDASEFIPRTTNGCGIDSQETSTNKINRDLLAFDAGTNEYAQYWFNWPTGWNTAKLTFYWFATGSSGDVVWSGSLKCYADGDAIDSAMGTPQLIVDTLSSANTIRQSSATPAITPAGTATSGRLTVLEIARGATNGSDTLAVDALLQQVLIEKAT